MAVGRWTGGRADGPNDLPTVGETFLVAFIASW